MNPGCLYIWATKAITVFTRNRIIKKTSCHRHLKNSSPCYSVFSHTAPFIYSTRSWTRRRKKKKKKKFHTHFHAEVTHVQRGMDRRMTRHLVCIVPSALRWDIINPWALAVTNELAGPKLLVLLHSCNCVGWTYLVLGHSRWKMSPYILEMLSLQPKHNKMNNHDGEGWWQFLTQLSPQPFRLDPAGQQSKRGSSWAYRRCRGSSPQIRSGGTSFPP